jgi:hypothetical protein
MEYKKAIEVLIKLPEKHKLNAEEKEAVIAAIGVLDCATLAENRMKGIIKAKKAKRDKSFE